MPTRDQEIAATLAKEIGRIKDRCTYETIPKRGQTERLVA